MGAGHIELERYPEYAAALKNNRTIDADDALSDPRTRDLAEDYLKSNHIYSMMDAPIRSGKELVGVVCFEHVGTRRKWEPQEISFAADLANTLSAALHEDLSRRNQAKVDEKRKLESIGSVAAGVAHDFNNVLQAIQGYSELAQALFEDGNTEKTLESLKDVQDAATRGSQLVSEILQFSRGEEMPRETVNLNELLDRSIRLVEPTIDKGTALRLANSSEPMIVIADEARLESVVLNLVENSAKALEGSGEIFVSLHREAFSLYEPLPTKLLKPGEHAVLTVEDNGPGIDEENIDRIFEPFFTTGKHGEGTGLGLASALQTVRAYNGDITVSSTPGKSTRFFVFLPRVT